MAKNELVSLALLTIAPMHAYAFSAIVDDMGMEHWAQVSRASLYAALGRLEKRGAIAVHTEKVDNMPERKVYSITAEGKALFETELHEAISSVHKSEPSLFHLGVNFFFGISADQGIALASKRATTLEQGLIEIQQKYEMVQNENIESAQLTLRAALKHATAELEACHEFIALLEKTPDYYVHELNLWRTMLAQDACMKVTMK